MKINIENNNSLEFNYIEDIPYSRDQILLMYWQNHARYRFFKTCKDGNFLDVGSGSGGLCFWREYGEPFRTNCKMYAMDLNKGEFVDNYEKFIQFDLDADGFPWEEDFFDNIYSTHVFEHLNKPEKLVKKLGRSLKQGGKVYIETPNHFSKNAPKRTEFQEVGITWATTTTNFYDDNTHLKPFSSSEIIDLFLQDTDVSYEVLESGTIWNDYLLDIMLSFAYKNKDTEIWTYAVWLYYHWSDYAIFVKK